MVKDVYNNEKYIKRVRSDILFIHGTKDKVVKAEHSKILKENCMSNCKTHLFEEMTHNRIFAVEQVAIPILKYAEERGFNFDGKYSIEFPDILFEQPPDNFNIK